MNISIIIPTLNEQLFIKQTLNRLQKFRSARVEIIVVDGGSTDGSTDNLDGLVDGVINSQRGRALQMNAGAAQAQHQGLLFLHVDTLLENLDDLLQRPYSNNAWGFSPVQLEPRTKLISIVAKMMNLRSRLSGIATGDQAIWVASDLFKQLSGFDEIPLMEDIALCKRLKRISKPIVGSQFVVSSSRRWLQQGSVRTIVKMCWFRLAFFIGVSPNYLAKIYRHVR